MTFLSSKTRIFPIMFGTDWLAVFALLPSRGVQSLNFSGPRLYDERFCLFTEINSVKYLSHFWKMSVFEMFCLMFNPYLRHFGNIPRRHLWTKNPN